MEDRMTDKQAGGDDTLATLVQWFEASEQSTEESRSLAERDRDYRHGTQWTPAEVEKLNKRRQPIVTIDRIGPKVDFLLGMEQQQRSDPKAYPRTPKEQDGADAATDSLRYVLDDNRWDRTRSESFDNFIVEGSCGVDVRMTEKYGEPCIELVPIMWDRMFWDPHARRRDFSDSKYLGQFVWMDFEDAAQAWPDKLEALESTITHESAVSGQTFDDAPRTTWADPKRKRVRIVEMWTREGGQVYFTQFTRAGILSRMESPYVNEDGKPEDGFVFGSCYVDRDGNRFGVVRRWISLQDEINKRRSKAMHMLNVRQVKAERGAVEDVNKARAELAKPDGYIEVTPGMVFEPMLTNDMAAAQFQLLQEAKSEIDAVGVNAALSGNEGRNMSGRALMARSEQGLNELGPVFDGFKQWQLDVYRKVWNRVRQFWTAEKWIRVTDDEKNVKFVGLNQPLTLGEQLLEEAKAQGQQVTPEMEQQAKMDPRMQVIVGTRNNVAQMDVDIVLDVVPATASLQIEQFQELAGLAKSGVPIPPDALIEASQLRNKDKILESMRGPKDQQQIPPQVEQAMQEAAQRIQQLEEELKNAQSGIQKAQMDNETRERIAALQADQKRDAEELKTLKELVLALMPVPQSLAGNVEEDLQTQ